MIRTSFIVMMSRALLALAIVACGTGVYATRVPAVEPQVVRELAGLRRAQTMHPESWLYLQERQTLLRRSEVYTSATADFHASEAARYSERGNYLALGLILVTASALVHLCAQLRSAER